MFITPGSRLGGAPRPWLARAMGWTSAQKKQARANIGSPDGNIIINGDFRVNQRVYVSAAALAAGIYGHDRWKAGAGGGDYSFTQLASSTQITIAASKTLIQVIEDRNVVGGSYVLSWTGTAQARYAINSATPAGSYASSPILIAGQTAGTTMSIEFGNGAASGTLGTVKLELGTVATPFVMTDDLDACLRYYEKSYNYATAKGTAVTNGSHWIFSSAIASQAGGTIYFKKRKRTIPTMTFYSPVSGATGQAYDYQATVDVATNDNFVGETSWSWYISKSNLATNVAVQWTAEAEL